MPGKKRTKTAKVIDREQIAHLDRRGWSQPQIAAKLKVSQPTISRDLEAIRKEYKEWMLLEVNEAVVEKHLQYLDMLKESLEEWDRSKGPNKKVVTRKEPERTCPLCLGQGKLEVAGEDKPCGYCKMRGKLGGVLEIVETVEGRVADPSHMANALKVLQAMRALHGLDKPVKVDTRHRGTQVNVNANVEVPWDAIMGMDLTDEVEDKLKQLEGEVKNLPVGEGEVEVNDLPALPHFPPPSTNGNGQHKTEE